MASKQTSVRFGIIVKLDPDSAVKLSDMETVLRWHKLFKGSSLSRRFSEGESLDDQDLKALQRNVAIWRNQLCDIGWFMRCIKEPLARMANREDNCKGRFWEGRFHSQALLDDQAVAACMIYVDLNPLRAGMCENPEDDEHTSLYARTTQKTENIEHPTNYTTALLPFSSADTPSVQTLPFTQSEYLNLLDNAARLAKPGKRGKLDNKARHTLCRLGIIPDHWSTITTEFDQRFHRVVGETTNILAATKALGTSRAWGSNACRQFFQMQASQA